MRVRIPGIVALVLPLLASSCGGGEDAGTAAGPPLEAAIVPGADFLLSVDVEAMRNAPIYAALADPDEAKAEPPQAAPDADGAASEFDGERFLELTGLKADDLVSVLISGDADGLDPEAGSARENLDKAAIVGALRLARDLDLDTLEKAIRESATGEKQPVLSRLQVGASPALRIAAAEPDEPDFFLAFSGSRTLFLAPNQASLAGALERAQSRKLAALDQTVERVRAALPAGIQGSLVFIAPEQLRTSIQGQLDAAADEPSAAMMAGFLKPFRKLQSLSFGMAAGTEITIVLAGDLGDDAAAGEASGVFGGLLAPMAHGALAEAAGRKPAEMADRLKVTSQGPMLNIQLRITAEDAAAFRKTAREKAAAAGS